jgi:hypothetical protein
MPRKVQSRLRVPSSQAISMLQRIQIADVLFFR